ncbi:pilus assembly PilX N-terminal domain-containing protein [Fredinandcohnia onubensis]|uniref:pilus assembly PilX N-terminal domain-containing protein n=1 Tax=Fredinandcohnia onubensis TaxID=1571209 RepID=UPI000C0BCD64|nr:pilus assembly PilX N-terminal domain-containing protein [Fredinandcohnia onubensis]
MKKKNSFLNNEKGVALVMVLLILTVVTILGLALMGLTLNNMKMSFSERTYQSTYYIAESGVTYTLDKVNKNIVHIYNNSTNKTTFFSKIDSMITDMNNELPYTNFEDAFGHQPEAKISIEKIGNQNANASHQDYKIISIGTIDNRSRTVEKQIRIKWVAKNNVEIPDTAIFVKENIVLGGNAEINGDIGTNSSASQSVNISGSASISGIVYVGPGSGADVINDNKIRVEELPYINVFDLPTFPDFPNNPFPADEKDVITNGSMRISNDYILNLNQDVQLNVVDVDKYTLNINVGNSNRYIVMNSLNINGGSINIIGTGKLTLYIKDNITIKSKAMINASDKNGNEITNQQEIMDQVKKLEIFYKGPSLKFESQQKIYGSVFVEYADIETVGQSGIQGHLISGGKTITINGENKDELNLLVYAPNANVELKIGSIRGSLISKSFSSNGGDITLYNYKKDELPPYLGGADAITSKDILSTEPTREK